MASTTLRLSLLLCLSISILSLALATTNASAPTAANATAPTATKVTTHIQEVCNKTLYSDLCIKSLSKEHTSQGADAHGLAAIALRLAGQSAATTSAYISGLLEGGGDDPALEQCLSDCSETFTDAVEQIDDSTAAFDKKSYADVNTWVSAAMTDADTCEESCQEMGTKKSTDLVKLVKRSEDFKKLCSITLSIIGSLPK